MARIFNPVFLCQKVQLYLQERYFARNKRLSIPEHFFFSGGVVPKSMQMITASPAVPVTI